MHLAAEKLHGRDPFLGRPAEPVGQVSLLGGRISEFPSRHNLLNHPPAPLRAASGLISSSARQLITDHVRSRTSGPARRRMSATRTRSMQSSAPPPPYTTSSAAAFASIRTWAFVESPMG